MGIAPSSAVFTGLPSMKCWILRPILVLLLAALTALLGCSKAPREEPAEDAAPAVGGTEVERKEDEGSKIKPPPALPDMGE